MLYRDSTEDNVAIIRAAEKQADRCLEHLRLATIPGDKAVWTLLTATISIIEEQHTRVGPDSAPFKAAMINLARYCPMIIRWLDAKLPPLSDPDCHRVWDSSLAILAKIDLTTAQNYDAFQCSYPMWYRNRVHAQIVRDAAVQFIPDWTARDRQVSAYQKGLRPLHGIFEGKPAHRVEPTEAILRRYFRILRAATVKDPFGFDYEHSYELARRTYNKYTKRLNSIMRRSEGIDLGGYTLGVFKRFYAGLQAISSIHEFLCFCWTKWAHPYPLSSAVIVKQKNEWVKLLANLSMIDPSVANQIMNDLTFHSSRLPDLHVYPFVPLDDSRSTLALIPQFVLNANPDDNILRICSYLRPRTYDLLSNDKETTMLEKLVGELKRFNVHDSIDLPDGSTQIDLLVEDESSLTVLIAELKWYRKPVTYRERLQTDEQFLDGVNRQLKTVKQYCRQYPQFLRERKRLTRDLTDYKNIYYMLIARDHWLWVEPTDESSVVEFEQFRGAIARHESLHLALSELLRYEWLPIEGCDFHVRFDSAMVEGVRIESEVFYAGPQIR
jgi:hypothetical protein